jgi:hypothetical protein
MHEALLKKSHIRRDGTQTITPRRHGERASRGDGGDALDRQLEEIRRGVTEAIASLGYHRLTAVKCEAAVEGIILSGQLPSYHLKQLAQAAALRVAGPGRVVNRVMVTSR